MGNIFEVFGCTHFQDQSGFKDKIKVVYRNVSGAEMPTLTDKLVTSDKETQVSIATSDTATGNSITTTENATHTDSLTTAENATLTDSLTTTENATLTDSLTTTENATLTDSLTTTENATLTDSLTTTENATLTDNLTTTEKGTQVSEEDISGGEKGKRMYSSEKEVKNSRMTGMCVLSPKYLVVADSENFCVSLYDIDVEKFVDSATLKPQRPLGVSKVGDDKVVVTIPTANYCQIFLVQNERLIEHGEIVAGGDCCGIAFNNCINELVLLSLGKMKVFSFKTNTAVWKLARSNIMSSIKLGNFGAYGTGQMPDNIALSPNNDVIYISSKFHNKIKAKWYDGNMELIREQAPVDMRKPEGIATDKNGNVYVCVFESSKVIKFSPNLEEQDTSFVWKVLKPVSIAYCESKHKLYAGTSGSIIIYSKDL